MNLYVLVADSHVVRLLRKAADLLHQMATPFALSQAREVGISA